MVGVAPALLKAAADGVLGKGQRGHQAHQLVALQVPAAGVREEGAGSVQGVGGWQSVVVLQQGLAGHTAHHPPLPLFLQVGQLVFCIISTTLAAPTTPAPTSFTAFAMSPLIVSAAS